MIYPFLPIVLLKPVATWLLTFAFSIFFGGERGGGDVKLARTLTNVKKDTGDDGCGGNGRDGHPYAACGKAVPLGTRFVRDDGLQERVHNTADKRQKGTAVVYHGDS